MSISVILSDRRFSLDSKRLISLAANVLKREKASRNSLNIVYCSDSLMSKLNSRFMDRRGPTDVMAFELSEKNDHKFIGEVYVNLQQAKRQADEYEVSYQQEVERLTVHGILHLLGYSDVNVRERGKMWARQESYL